MITRTEITNTVLAVFFSCTLKSSKLQLNKCQNQLLVPKPRISCQVSIKKQRSPLSIAERKRLAPFICTSVGHLYIVPSQYLRRRLRPCYCEHRTRHPVPHRSSSRQQARGIDRQRMGMLIEAAGQRYRQTTQFSYLGGLVDASADVIPEIRRRTRLACMGMLQSIQAGAVRYRSL